MRGNPEETEVIRMFSGKYDPKNYAYYSSYSHAGVKETTRRGSILKSPTVVVGLLGIVFAGWWFAGGNWLSAPPDVQARAAALPPPPALPIQPAALLPVVLQEVKPVRVEGGMLLDRNGRSEWVYVTDEGRMLTSEEIAAVSGGIVNTRMESGVRRLYGSGVVWGGEKENNVAVSIPVSAPSMSPPSAASQVPEGPIFQGNGKDLLATPPDLR